MIEGFTLTRIRVGNEANAKRLAVEIIGTPHPVIPGFKCDKARAGKGVSFTWKGGRATNLRDVWEVYLEYGNGESF